MSVNWLLLNSRVSTLYLILTIVLSCFPGFIFSAVVTLDSIAIFNTHEWLKVKPTVYFMCKGENKTVLPDVKKIDYLYTFKGQESWQPLVELSSKKCKRCGFYEEDTVNSDDIFDEWEFCPSDFTASDGKYLRSKEKEYNATFSCPQCLPLDSGSSHASGSHKGGHGLHILIVILISSLVSIVSILGMIAAYKYWQKRKRDKEQAQFLKLFEDGDDIEDELGLGTII